MKVLYLTFDGITDPLGQSQVLPYVEGLAKQGVQFQLVSLEKNLKKAREFLPQIQNPNIHWYRLRYVKVRFLGAVINEAQVFFRVFFVLLSKSIDIFHCRSYLPLVPALVFQKFFGYKIIFDMRGFWPEGLVEVGRIKKDSAAFTVLKMLERWGVLCSDHIVVLTPEAQEMLVSQYPKKAGQITWMPTCVDEEKFGNVPPISFAQKFVIVYSGSLWNYCDTPAMLDFFVAVKKMVPEAHFLLLGNNQPEKILPLFAERNISEKAYTVLTVPPSQVPAYLAGSQVGISFRKDFYSEKAAFPTKLAEYLMSGLPVVANTASPHITHLITSQKVGIIVEAFNSESFQKAATDLLALMKDPNLPKRCQETAKKYLENRVCINAYANIYHELQKL